MFVWYVFEVNLADWARRQGISYTTARHCTKDDAIPVPWRKIASGLIPVDAAMDEKPTTVAPYARASNHDQRYNLDQQLSRLSQDAAHNERLYARHSARNRTISIGRAFAPEASAS